MSKKETDDSDKWEVFAGGSEYLKGKRENDPSAYRFTGLVDSEAMLHNLIYFAKRYNPKRYPRTLPETFEETQFVKEIVSGEETKTLTKDLKRGHAHSWSRAIGEPESRSDLSGLTAIRELEALLAGKAPVIYIFGHMGAGKTNKAFLFTQDYDRIHHTGDIENWEPKGLKNIEVATNVKSAVEQNKGADRYVNTFQDTKSFFEENIKTENGKKVSIKNPTPKIYIHDEAGTSASGKGKQGYDVGTKYSDLIFAIRKAKGAIIVIGHGEKSVHPIFRTLGKIVEAHKDSPKKMTFWEDVNESGETTGLIHEFKGVPATDLVYDDTEHPTFQWSKNTSEKDSDDINISKIANQCSTAQKRKLAYIAEKRRRENYLDMDMRQSDVADLLGVSDTFISEWYNKIKDGKYEPDEVMDIS